jgi:hypothetical protein
MEPENSELKLGDLHSVKSYAAAEPAVSEGGLRWIIFQHKDELIEKGIIVYMGSKLIIVGDKMSRHIREGGLTT